tara:strand:- start:2913 stop:3890 length:978 start_codon:yes stop_codon:yes gene_type:complete
MKKPFLSIIITTYNEQKYIHACLESIYKNNFKNIEVLIVDDASTDKTIKIIKKFPVKLFILKKNKGAAFAKNFAIKKAKSNFIFFIDADATLQKNILSKMIKIIKKHKNLSGINGIWSDTPINKGYFPKYQSVDMNFAMKSMAKKKYSFHWGNGSLIKKKILLDLGGFNEKFKGAGAEDYELALRIPKNKKFLVKKNLISMQHNFPYFFFSGVKKYISRSKRHIEVLLNFKTNDKFHTTKKNFLILILSNLIIFSSLINYDKNIFFFGFFLTIYFFLNLKKLIFIKQRNNIIFLFYFFFMSLIVNFLISVGSAIGCLSYFLKKIK